MGKNPCQHAAGENHQWNHKSRTACISPKYRETFCRQCLGSPEVPERTQRKRTVELCAFHQIQRDPLQTVFRIVRSTSKNPRKENSRTACISHKYWGTLRIERRPPPSGKIKVPYFELKIFKVKLIMRHFFVCRFCWQLLLSISILSHSIEFSQYLFVTYVNHILNMKIVK